MTPDRIAEIILYSKYGEAVFMLATQQDKECAKEAALRICSELSSSGTPNNSSSHEEREIHIHYLKILQKNYTFMQPEMREAIDFAVHSLSQPSSVLDEAGATAIGSTPSPSKEGTEPSADAGEKTEIHIHYLRVLQKNYTFMQPEMREAIDFAINSLSQPRKDSFSEVRGSEQDGVPLGELEKASASVQTRSIETTDTKPKDAPPKGE